MNTMKQLFCKLQGLFFGLTLLLLLAAVSSCSSDHAKILPEDCAGVVKVDVKKIFEKSGLEGSTEMKDWKDKALEMAEKELSSSAYKRFKEMLENPSEFGVDLRQPMYIYAPSKSFPYAGFVAKVLDDDDLYSFLEMMVNEDDKVGKFKEYDNCRMLVSRDGEAALAFDGDIMILAVDIENGGRLTRDLGKRFEEMDEHSILDNPAFAEMDGRGDDVAACLIIENLMKVLPAGAEEEVKKATEGYDVKGFSVLAGLSFNDASVDAYMETLAMSDKAKEQMEESGKVQKEVTGKYLEKVSKEAFAVGGFGFSGSDFWKMISRNELVKQYLSKEPEMAKMIEDVVKAVDGEGLFAIAAPQEGEKEPVMSAFMDIKNRSAVDALMARITGLETGVEAAVTEAVADTVAIADDYDEPMSGYGDGYGDYWAPTTPEFSKDPSTGYFRYCVNRYSDTPKFISFGTTDKMFFISNKTGFKPEGKVASSLAKADYADRIKGKTGFLVVDFTTLFKNAEVRHEINNTPLKKYSDNLATFEVYSEKPAKVSASFRLKDMSKNATALSLLVNFITDCVERYA